MTDAVHAKRSQPKTSRPAGSITGWGRFWIGGLGALLPLLVTLLAVDVGGLIDHHENLTLGIYVGTAIRYVVLFALGGIVAALNSDEEKPIRLVQLGIAAPALITSFVNLSPATTKTESSIAIPAETRTGALLGLVGAAQAVELLPYKENDRAPIARVGFLDDLVRGATNNVAGAAQANAAAAAQTRAAADRARAEAAARAAAEAASHRPPTRAIAPIEPRRETAEALPVGGDPFVRRAQQYLIALGYDVPEASGMKDAPTAAAIIAFKEKHGLAGGDAVDKPVLQAMKTALVNQADPG